MKISLAAAPERLVLISGLFAAGICVVAVLLSTQVRNLGLLLEPGEHGPQVVAIYAGNNDLQAGDELHSISAGSSQLPLRNSDLSAEPDMVFVGVPEYQAFLNRQGQLYRLLQHDNVVLHSASGKTITWPVASQRNLRQLPWTFWLQLACGVLALLIGATVWAYRQNDSVAAYFALTSVFLMLSAVCAAVYSSRELALPGHWFNALRMGNQAGTLLYTGSFISVMWYYPRPAGRLLIGPVLLASYALVTAACWYFAGPSLDLSLRLPVLLGFTAAIGLGLWQWRRWRHQADDRAAIRWFLYSWFVGSGLFLAIIFVPPLFGASASDSQGPAFALLLAVHAALAAGIARHGLFELDRWWYRSCLYGLTGLLILLVYLLLQAAAPLDQLTDLAIALAVAGWLFYPLRQWLWQWLVQQRRGHTLSSRMQAVVNALDSADSEEQSGWQALLDDMFQPGQIMSARHLSDRIADNGLSLQLAAHDLLPSLTLHYAAHGQRLFRPPDLQLVDDLRSLFVEVIRYKNLVDTAVQSERERVARDLHDDVGARLLTLSQRLDGSSAQWARDALSELRAVVYSMTASAAPLSELLADWRAEVAERCEINAVELDWPRQALKHTPMLDGGTSLAIGRILRELVTNALRHNRLQSLSVRLALSADNEQLHGCVEHSYNGAAPATWQNSLGLVSLQNRVTRLRGQIDWQTSDGRLACRWQVNLQADSHPTQAGVSSDRAQTTQ